MSTPDTLSATFSRLIMTGSNCRRRGSLTTINAWKTAHSTLELAIERFVDASSSLESFCSVDCYNASFTPFQSPHDDIDQRIHSLISRLPNLHQALSTATAARKRCYQQVFINKLPRELLLRVLHLVVRSELHNLREPEEYRSIPMERQRRDMARAASYPGILSGVCRAWHGIVLGTPVLWSHIDLMAPEYQIAHSYIRSNLFLSRSGNHPLDLRIHAGLQSQPTDALTIWLTAFMPRARCVELIGWFDNIRLETILHCWIEHATPKIMTTLNLRYLRFSKENNFLNLTPGSESDGPEFPVSHERHEEVLCSVTRLTLTGVFFDWDSKAYHQLTHLQLSSGSISTTEIHAILVNSPRLRVLALGISLIEDSVESTFATANLPDLETLVYNKISLSDPALFRIIAPAPNLRKLGLQFDQDNQENREEPRLGDLLEFLRHSAITTLYISNCPDPTLNLLNCLPDLRLLGLENHKICRTHDTSSLFNPEPVVPQLRELYLAVGYFSLDWLKSVSQVYPNVALRISNAAIWRNTRAMKAPEILERIPGVFSDFKCNYSHVIHDWEPRTTWGFAYIE